MNKKGFTLVELLAVVVIIALILAIAVPNITNLIATSKKNMFENSSKMILKSMKNDYDGKVASTGTFTDTFILYENGVRTVYPSSNNLDFSISATDGGIVRHSDGTVTMALYDGTNCLVKTRYSNDLVTTLTDKPTCLSNIIYKQASAPFNNIFTNGDFSNGTTGWGFELTSTNPVINGKMFLYSTTTYNTLRFTRWYAFETGKKYYTNINSIESNATFGNLHFQIYDYTYYSKYDESISYKSTRYSSIFTLSGSLSASTRFSWLFEGYGPMATSTYYAFDNVVLLDLTALYGAGNEPTKDQMDNNLNKVWIDTANGNTPKKFDGGGWVSF